MSEDGVLRKHSEALDDVIGYCRELSVNGAKPVDVEVTGLAKTVNAEYGGETVPASHQILLKYHISREDMPEYPINREEAVSSLAVTSGHKEFGLMLRTSVARPVTEANLQIIVRLAVLYALKEKGIVKNLRYMSGKTPMTDVTPEFLDDIAGGAEIPSEVYQMVDDFRSVVAD